MPRNYYCDFCTCTFPDNVTNRRNHNQGITHVNNRKLHYDWFNDPDAFIQSQLKKPPCKRYLEGYCQLGLTCKYSHISFDPTTGQHMYPPELVDYIKTTDHNITTTIKKIKTTRYRLPKGWKVKDLPPSLKPPPSKYGYNWDPTTLGSW